MFLVDFWVLRDPGDHAAVVVVQPEDAEKCMAVSLRLRGGTVYKDYVLCKKSCHCAERHAHAVVCAGYVSMLCEAGLVNAFLSQVRFELHYL